MSIDVEQDATTRKVTIDRPWSAVPPARWYSWLKRLASSELAMWGGLVILLSALPLLHINVATIADPDIWWHMRAGEWILQHHQIPRFDTFSSSRMGKPWIDYSWLFQLVINWFIAHFDLVTIMWYQIVMRLAITAALLALLRSITPHFWRAVILTGLVMIATIQMFGPRPGLFSILFLIVELHLLLLARRTGSLGALWAIPFLFAIWANIHVELVHGLFVVGIFCLEPILERISGIAPGDRTATAIPSRTLWFVLGASLLATVANPYGIGLHLTAIQFARETKVYNAIGELRAMPFRHPADWAVLVIAMLACFALGRSRVARPVWVILLGWSAWMGFRSLREVWLLAIIGAVIIAGRDFLDPATRTRLGTQMRLAVGTTVAVLLWAGAAYCRMNSQNLLRDVSAGFPVGAVAYIHEHHLHGPMVNEFSWGGFLIYALPEIPVSMDGRGNLHGQDDVLRSISMYRGEAGWRNQPELQKANLVVCDHVWPLTELLRNDPKFHVVYEDRVSVLFQAGEKTPAKNEQKPAVK
jgi:hypothetical protein